VVELWLSSLKQVLKDELWTGTPSTVLELWTAFPRLDHNCEWVHSYPSKSPLDFRLWAM
jgi:hypothetical protein